VKDFPSKTIADIDAASEGSPVLHCSKEELERLLDAKMTANHSKLALLATIIAIVALLGSAAQGYMGWRAYSAARESAAEMSDLIRATNRDEAWEGDARLQASIAELARRAPSLDKGTLQAWWAGEQARQVQALEANAKRQTLAGDREGAAVSARRADAIRSGIDVLATFERPQRN
jgi:hypothetical protein